MAIVTKGSGGQIRFSGTGGALRIPGSGGGGGGGGFSYRYYRMVIKETKYTQGYPVGYWTGTQFTELEVLLASNRINYSGAIATADSMLTSGQTPTEAIDNDSSTKWYTGTTPSTATPVIFKIDFGIAQTADAFRYMTAGDGPGRDPIRWTFEGSNDDSTWTVLHTQNTDATITDSRTTFTQEFPFTV